MLCARVVWIVLSGLLSCAFAIASDPCFGADDEPADAERLFARKILPLLEDRCFACHGKGDDLEGGLDLTSRDAALAGGDTGPALIPGEPEESLLFEAVMRTGDLEMPPKENAALDEQQIALLRKWIIAGAPWSDVEAEVPNGQGDDWDDADGITVATSGGLSASWTNRRYAPDDVWAFRPVRRPDVPWDALPDDARRHPVDAFVVAKLQAAGIDGLAPRAGPRVLLRRATFDLWGLPPSPEQVENFASDGSDEAWEELIDRLVGDDHYGEQLARHWLDVVRYADTCGFSNDYERPNAWRYRDYVIRSFNADKPFDRFVIEQIAGDELDPDDPEMLIATGYLRMGPWEHTGMAVAAVTRQAYLDDITNNVGQVFLGQGLRCCRCHDHKFDPVPTRDYYRMQACFSPVQFAEREVDFLDVENTGGFDEGRARTERLLADSRAELKRLRDKSDAAIAEYLKEQGVEKLSDIPADKRPQRTRYGLSYEELSRAKIYFKRVAYFERELIRYEPLALSVYSGPTNGYTSVRPFMKMPEPEKRQGLAEVIHILDGGALESPGEPVSPGVLSAMTGANDALVASAWNTIPDATEGRRLALAHWIASPQNSLTSRVIVNRIWQRHFGTGLVPTSNNFGKMGERPSHPELLDWLATWFVEHGWSIKALDRLIMTSQTYRQSSDRPDLPEIREQDTNNRLLSVFPVRRLAAEELRDALLAVSGELNPEMGGPGVFPEINWEVAMQPRHIMGSVAPAYQPSPTPSERHRRSIYAFRYRTLPDPMQEVFNRPGSDTSCERRDETTVTPQVFALFNGQFAHDRALALADRIARDTTEPAGQAAIAFQRIYGREPAADEIELAVAHIEQMRGHHAAHEPVRVDPPTSVERAMVEELTGETFTWTEELIGMDRFVPDLKPWNVDPDTRALAELCLVLMNSNEFVYIR